MLGSRKAMGDYLNALIPLNGDTLTIRGLEDLGLKKPGLFCMHLGYRHHSDSLRLYAQVLRYERSKAPVGFSFKCEEDCQSSTADGLEVSGAMAVGSDIYSCNDSLLAWKLGTHPVPEIEPAYGSGTDSLARELSVAMTTNSGSTSASDCTIRLFALINAEGKIGVVHLLESVDNVQLRCAQELLSAIGHLKAPWNPATSKHRAVNCYIRLDIHRDANGVKILSSTLKKE